MSELDDLQSDAEQAARSMQAKVACAADEDGAARVALGFLAKNDWLGWALPEAYGGRAVGGRVAAEKVSVEVLCAVRRGLARGCGMVDLMFVEQGLGSYALALGGAEDLAQELMGEYAAGTRIAAFAVTEKDAGSDLAGVSTQAVRTDRGYCLTGAKTFITNAGIAHDYTLLARVAGEPGDRSGLAMFRVPASARGLEVKRFEVMASHPIGEVILNDVQVDQRDLIGEEGQGLDLALGVLARFRTSVAAAAVGFGERALEESLAHLKSRKQFGRSLSSFQGLRFDLAEMDTRLAAAALLVSHAAACVDAEEDSKAEVARAKLFATETASWVCDKAVQHHGGLGVRRGTVVELLFREVRALRIYEGTSEIQKLIIAKHLLNQDTSS
jgi:acyl-CoA dehydrogenase